MDKYYTPTIDEFHKGFEYEFFNQEYHTSGEAKQPDENSKWVKRIFNFDETDGEQGFTWWTGNRASDILFKKKRKSSIRLS